MSLNPGSKYTVALLVAAASAALSMSTANAAIPFTGGTATVSDTGDRHTVAATLPVPVDSTVPLTGLYGTPTVTSSTSSTKFDFTALSSQFRASANSSLFNATESVDTDGKLMMTLHFDTPTALSAQIYEDGLYQTTGGGSVAIKGGGIVIDALGAPPGETHGGTFTTTQNNGVWTAVTIVGPFNGTFTDYQITVDNDIQATAPSGATVSSADIFKKDFILSIGMNSGSGRNVPEPASLGLLALGAAGLFVRRRR